MWVVWVVNLSEYKISKFQNLTTGLSAYKGFDHKTLEK